jgi:RNA recognition motif-containing protein
MTIYVGNIPYALREPEISEVFSKYGKIISIKIITDKYSGRSKGYGFVEMENDEQEEQAIRECNKYEISGRSLVVMKAHLQKGHGSTLAAD